MVINTHFLHITHNELGTCFYFSFPPQHQSCRGLVDVLLKTHMHATEHPYISAKWFRKRLLQYC